MKEVKFEFLLISPNISYTALFSEYARAVVLTLKMEIWILQHWRLGIDMRIEMNKFMSVVTCTSVLTACKENS